MDWLAFEESTYPYAVVRINSVLRYFMCKSSGLSRRSLTKRFLPQGAGNLFACQELRERRPEKLRDDPPGSPADRYEYLHFERFFVAWAALGLSEHLAAQTTRPGRIQHKDREVEKYEVCAIFLSDQNGN